MAGLDTDALGSELAAIRTRIAEVRDRCNGHDAVAQPLDVAIQCVDEALARSVGQGGEEPQ